MDYKKVFCKHFKYLQIVHTNAYLIKYNENYITLMYIFKCIYNWIFKNTCTNQYQQKIENIIELINDSILFNICVWFFLIKFCIVTSLATYLYQAVFCVVLVSEH